MVVSWFKIQQTIFILDSEWYPRLGFGGGIMAGCDMVSPLGAVIGTICSILMIFSVEFIDKVLKIDDPVGVKFRTQGSAVFTGTILTGFLSTSEGLFYGAGWGIPRAQVFGALVVGMGSRHGFSSSRGLDRIHGLRVSKRVEEEGLDIYMR